MKRAAEELPRRSVDEQSDPARVKGFAAASWSLFKDTYSDWSEDKAPRLGAALAYYMVFSLAPILVIALAIAALLFDPVEVESEINRQFERMLGTDGAEAVAILLKGAQKPHEGIAATVIGVIALAFGAVGVFVQLKDAMNTIWEVRAKPSQGVWTMLRTYILSLTMVLGIGLLLMVLLIVSALVSAMSAWLSARLPVTSPLLHVGDLIVSIFVATILFAMIFKFLPDVKIAWRDVWLGAFVTSLLFTLGKYLIGLYLGQASFTSSYGAVGTILIVLVWTYYSAQILFLGAELTQVYARRYGSRIEPAENAEPVTEEMKAQQGVSE